MDQHARRVVPRHQLRHQQEIHLGAGEAEIFMRGRAQGFQGLHPVAPVLHPLPEPFVAEIARQQHAAELGGAFRRRQYPQTVRTLPGTLARRRRDRFVRHGIVDPAGRELSVPQQRHDHGEKGPALGEIVGAVHRIDDPAPALAREMREKVGIGRGRLFADHARAGQDVLEGAGELPLGRLVGDGDEVARPLLADIARAQLVEARHDLRRRHLRDDGADPVDVGDHAPAVGCRRW